MAFRQGAEAVILRTEWHGRPAVEKRRVPKDYRHPALDNELRTARIRQEARLFREARSLGVAVPILFDVDLAENRLVMEFVEGPLVKEVLEEAADLAPLCRELGRAVGRLHAGDVVHGDLTTSNMILRQGRPVFLDFGLGERSGEVEAQGVDLHLFREAFRSAHSERMDLFAEVLGGYREANPKADAVIQRMEDIERRGRYMRGS